MSRTAWRIGKASSFDTDSDGNYINSLVGDDYYDLAINPREHSTEYGNLGSRTVLLNGAPRFVRQANSEVKRVWTLSQDLVETTQHSEFETILGWDEDLVCVSDSGDIIKCRVTGFSTNRRRTTANRAVSYTWSLTFEEL